MVRVLDLYSRLSTGPGLCTGKSILVNSHACIFNWKFQSQPILLSMDQSLIRKLRNLTYCSLNWHIKKKNDANLNQCKESKDPQFSNFQKKCTGDKTHPGTGTWECSKYLCKSLERHQKSSDIFGYVWVFFENPGTPR